MTMNTPIRLIVGLGNPGSEYDQTRHNAGFQYVDKIAAKASLQFRPERKFAGDVCTVHYDGARCLLLKPTTYMNRSGQAVRAVIDYYQIPVDALLVVHDDLDLPPGTIRLKQGGGHGGHNGLRDLCAHLGDPGFLRLRVGIGHPGNRDDVTPYVLGRPSVLEETTINESLALAVDFLPEIIKGEHQKIMNHLHRRRSTPQP